MYRLPSRRVALKMLAGAFSVLPFGREVEIRPQQPTELLSLFPLLKDRFADRLSLHAAAEAYFGQYPAEFGLTRLCSLLLDGIGPCAADCLPDRLKRCVTREFAAGEVVLVGGWVLARSEARLIAAASLATTGV